MDIIFQVALSYFEHSERFSVIKRGIRRLAMILAMSGIDLIKLARAFRGIPFFIRDFLEIRRQKTNAKENFIFVAMYPCLGDRFAESGDARGHYFHQDLLVARKIFDTAPEKHVDIGSRIDGFIAHVASYRKIEVFDIRPLSVNLPNIKFVQCDLMGNVGEEYVNYCDSLSCLHTLEHFGLGRYGDTVKYDGYVDGFNNLEKILKKGGILYFSVPVGPQRIEFNAHRVFSVRYLLELFKGRFEVTSFSYVDDAGQLKENVPLTNEKIDVNYDCQYGCGIFELRKV